MERELEMYAADNRLTARLSYIDRTLQAIQDDNRKDNDIIDMECLERIKDQRPHHFLEKPIISSGASQVLRAAFYRTLHGAIDEVLIDYLGDETPVGNVIQQCILAFTEFTMMEYYILNNPLMSVSIKYDIHPAQLGRKRVQQEITAGQKDIFVNNRANLLTHGGPDGNFDGFPNFVDFINCYRDSLFGVKDLIKGINDFTNGHTPAEKLRDELSKQPHLSRLYLEYGYFYERDDSKLAEIPDEDEDEDDDIEVECRIMEVIKTVAAVKYDSMLRVITHDFEAPLLTVQSTVLPGIQ